MPPIAGLRGVLPDAAKLKEIAEGKGDAAALLATVARDPSKAVYRYHQIFTEPGGSRPITRKTLICAVRLEPWAEGSVRPHAATLAPERDAALAQLRAARLEWLPVFAGYRDAPNEADRLLRKAESEKPTVDYTTPDGTVHRIWRIANAETVGQIRRLFAPKKLQVLDGHERYEAALAYQGELDAKAPLSMYSSGNYVLACLVNMDDPALVVAPRHRVVSTEHEPAAALAAAAKYFIVEKLAGAAKDAKKQTAALAESVAHQPAFLAVFAGGDDAYKLTLKPDVSVVGEGVSIDRALQKFDPVVATELFVTRVLGGQTLETTPDAATAVAGAAKGGVALIMRALGVDQLRQVTELGALLPAGSTAFHPRLAPGVVAFPIDPDEDVV